MPLKETREPPPRGLGAPKMVPALARLALRAAQVAALVLQNFCAPAGLRNFDVAKSLQCWFSGVGSLCAPAWLANEIPPPGALLAFLELLGGQFSRSWRQACAPIWASKAVILKARFPIL